MTSRRIAALVAATVGVAGLTISPAAATTAPSVGHPRLWKARFDGPASGVDEAKAVAVDPTNHNVYVTGYDTGIANGTNFVTIAYAPTGERLWVARYDGPAHLDDQAFAVAVDPGNHNVYVVGYSGKPGADGPEYAYVTIGYDATTGSRLWVARYDGPGSVYVDPRQDGTAFAIAVDTANHNVYVAGSFYFRDNPHRFAGYATVGYGAAGDRLWARLYGGLYGLYGIDQYYGAWAKSIVVDPGNHNVYVTGNAMGQYDRGEYATVAYDATGTQLWIGRYDYGAFDARAYSVAVDPGNHNVYVTGGSGAGKTGDGYATVAYTPTGTQLWVARYDGNKRNASPDDARSVTVDPGNHDVYVTGWAAAAGGNATIAYAPDGTQLWTASYDPPQGFSPVAVAIDPSDHNVYVTGSSRTVAFDSAGAQLWAARDNGPGNNWLDDQALAVDPSNDNVYVTGWSPGAGTDYGYATLAYPGL